MCGQWEGACPSEPGVILHLMTTLFTYNIVNNTNVLELWYLTDVDVSSYTGQYTFNNPRDKAVKRRSN